MFKKRKHDNRTCFTKVSKVVYKERRTYTLSSYDRHQEYPNLQEGNEDSRQDDLTYEDPKSV